MEKTNLVELFVYSQIKTTKDGRKFTKFSTKANFVVKDENGEILGKKPKYINLRFTKDAFDGSKVKLSEIKRGLLVVDGKCVSCPTIYEITEKDGKKVYPECWIRGGVQSFTPIHKEHQFDFVTEEDLTEIEEE